MDDRATPLRPQKMIDRTVRVIIQSVDERPGLRCAGPGSDGGCPLGAEGQELPCAGRVIVPLHGTTADGRPLSIGLQGGPFCPLDTLVRYVRAPWS